MKYIWISVGTGLFVIFIIIGVFIVIKKWPKISKKFDISEKPELSSTKPIELEFDDRSCSIYVLTSTESSNLPS